MLEQGGGPSDLELTAPLEAGAAREGDPLLVCESEPGILGENVGNLLNESTG